MMKPSRAVLGVGLLLLLPGRAMAAGGFQSIEQGTWDVGRAVVGASSAADSAATAFYNPAAMTLLEETEVTFGVTGVLAQAEFQVRPGTTFSGSDGGDAGSNAVFPAGPFVAYPIGEKWALGFSVTAPFIGALDYSRDWAGRYVVRDVSIASYRAGPSVAYRVTDWLSLGGTVAMNYTRLDYKVAIPTLGNDGKLDLSQADEWEPSWGASALIEPFEGTRIGINYTSEVKNDDMSGDLELTLPGPLPSFNRGSDVEVTLPQTLTVSIRQELTDDLVMFLDAAWADFSEFSSVSLDLSSGASVSGNLHFKDTMLYGVGAEYRLDPQWTLTAGYSRVGSPVERKNRTPALPFDTQQRFAAGVRYRWLEDVVIALSYEYVDLGECEINHSFNGGTLRGKYDPNRAQFLVLTASKSF